MAYDFKNKVFLVTGASRGIGYQVSLALAAKGVHVVALARTVGGLEELDDAIKNIGGTATLIPFDLKKTKDILTLGPTLAQKFSNEDIGPLDGLIANAGVLGTLTPVAHAKAKEWDDVIAINLTANQRLIATLDPLLRHSDAGRAVFLTSGITQMVSPYWGAYGVTKIALEKLVETYAAETKLTNLKVVNFDPGVAATNMRAAAFPGENPDTLQTPKQVADKLVSLLEDDAFETGSRLSV